jgi:hypothetical protein
VLDQGITIDAQPIMSGDADVKGGVGRVGPAAERADEQEGRVHVQDGLIREYSYRTELPDLRALYRIESGQIDAPAD